jgi:hypothetical protein
MMPRSDIPVRSVRSRIPVVLGILFLSASSAIAEELPPVRFGTEVVPVLTRLGCNSGGCHGKATGQNGFRLSLLGFEPEFDYEAIVRESRGRRLFPAAAEQSLLLLKGTAQMPHGGGKRLDAGSEDYQILLQWIREGASPPRSDDPQLERIELTPAEQILIPDTKLQLTVRAWFSDGTSRDVTRQSVYQTNESDIATVDADGCVTTGSKPGLVAVMARFGEKIETFQAALPFVRDTEHALVVAEKLNALEQTLGDAAIDRLLLQQWRRLGIVPSGLADDTAFLRRVSIDICGTLPTVDEINAYVSENRPDKRQRLIDRLLDRSEYASYFSLKWGDILQNRGAGYSTSQQRAGTTLFSAWIRDSIANNKPYDQFVSEILTASGSQSENPPTLWYRTVRKSPEYVESVAQAFLGVRIQCAQCHHHPSERWSQTDYYRLAAVFARVGRKGGFADAEVPTDEVIFVSDKGSVVHPRTGEVLAPAALGSDVFRLDHHVDPREQLAEWMTQPDNPFFARTMVNRMWAHFLGRGIIHPIDDARSTNPPSNPKLLDALAADFVASGYDIKQLIRSITNSYAYRLDSVLTDGNAEDTQSFARFYPRRMSAEVLLDGISQVLDVPTQFASGAGMFPTGTRAIDLPDENVPAAFLDIFGRPGRMSACECERVDAPALTQALELVNSAEIQRKLTEATGFAHQIALAETSNSDRATRIFLRTLGRAPRTEELKISVDYLDGQSDPQEACRSLLWSLLATNEFLFNH